ncbi:type II CAAX prenyl endopeptidase Rce1 family protein [Microbacterium sp.]|uniref:CPBP family glutamic-type intramembrane protease n=1 Tax=Microbacterium sp. TaxID=51671 RepID=UPI003A87FC7D
MDIGSTSPVDLTPTRVRWPSVIVYVVVACALAWLVQLPVWVSGDGLASPLFLPLTAAMMFTPAVSALIVVFTMVRPPRPARYLGLTPFRPIARSIVVMVLWPVVWLLLGFAAVGLAVAFGLAQFDVPEMTLPDGTVIPGAAVLALSILALPLNALIGSIPAFGEELGWRGFLATALAPLGFWKSALIGGVIWGVWHAPIILLGYNFARPDLVGLALMCAFTIGVGVILQVSRWWCRNVWVAAVGHGSLNAAVPLSLLVIASGSDTAMTTLLGAPGWIVMGVVIAILAAVGLTGRRLPHPLVPAPRAVAGPVASP